MPADQLVSIIIVTFNGRESLTRCLDSVFRQPYRPLDVVVVDNASTDDTHQMVRTQYPEVRLVRNQTNRGFAGGNNDGVAQALADVCLLLNDDTTVEAGWIPGLLSKLAEPMTGAVTSRVVTGGVPGEFYEMNGSLNYVGYNIMRVFTDLSTVFFAGGASLMFRRSEVGRPFPEEYFIYHEDVFLSWSLRLGGKQVRMAQDSVVRHTGGVTTRKHSSRTVTFYQVRNRLLNLLLCYEVRTLVRLAPYLVADACATILEGLFVRRRSVAGIFKAWYWIVTHRTWIQTKRDGIQGRRVVSDREILSLMSPKVLQGEGTLATLGNRISRWYADSVGLAYHG